MLKKEFIFVLIFTFLVVMVWVGANIIHTKSAVPITPELQETLDPVDPVFDADTLNKVSQIKPLGVSQSAPAINLPPAPSSSPQASSSALPKVASQSAILNP